MTNEIKTAKIYSLHLNFEESDDYYCVDSNTMNFVEYRLYDGEIIDNWPEGVLFLCRGRQHTHLLCGGHYYLVSDVTRNVFLDNNLSGVQFLPAKVVHVETEIDLGQYWVINVYHEVDSLKNYKEGGDIFRLSTSIFITHRVKKMLEDASAIGGFSFRPVSDKTLNPSGPRPDTRPPKLMDPELEKKLEKSRKEIESFYSKLFKPVVSRYGKLDDNAIVPIIGFDMGGPLILSSIGEEKSEEFVTYLTSELVFRDKQKTGMIGKYELMMTCNYPDWCRGLLSDIGRMSFDALFENFHTLDIGTWVEEDFPIQGIIFEVICSMKIKHKRYGVLNCIGITRDELEYALVNGAVDLIKKLEINGIYPKTDVDRKSILLCN